MQTFEPDQRVLVRENDTQVWRLTHYSHTVQGMDWNATIDGKVWASQFIIPYAENEHLLGTTESPAPKWEPKPGELVAVRQSDKTSWRPRIFAYRKGKYFVCQHEEFHNVKDDGWHYCEPLRKHFTIPEE